MEEEEEGHIQKNLVRLEAEIEETREDLEGSTEEEIKKALIYYLIEAEVDLEGTFRAYDRFVTDKNLEKTLYLEVEIAQTLRDLEGATVVLKGLLQKYRTKVK